MAGLQFPFQELIREGKELKRVARRLLDPATSRSLDAFVSSLESLESDGEGQSRRVKLDELRSIKTRCYDRSPGRDVCMSATGVWDLCPVGKMGPGRIVEFCGLASMRVTFRDAGESGPDLAAWTIELGDDVSPGCYFHMHVPRDTDKQTGSGLPVPRLPSLFVTPMAALEYALGELFQEEWSKAISESAAAWWNSTQKERLCKLLTWQREEAARGSSSPWMRLKVAKPNSDLFL